MTEYKTKRDVDAEIERLKKLRDELPDVRPVSEGWDMRTWNDSLAISRNDPRGEFRDVIAVITDRGLVIRSATSRYFDGIAHDDNGRIKVVGYVPKDLLLQRLVDIPHTRTCVEKLIDELAG